MSLKAVFTTSVEPSSVNAYTFQLLRSGDDALFGNGNDVSIPAGSYAVSGNEASMNLAGMQLPLDLYQVRLVGRGANPVSNSSGWPLDGRFNGSLPSGDGTGGEDFVATFALILNGDLDGDGDADQEDFGRLQRCLGGAAVSGCQPADFDRSGQVDAWDLGWFLGCLRGPGAAPGCN